MVIRLQTRPSHSFAARLRKKAPWPQSCWMMKMRTIRPAAGSARARLSQGEMPPAQYIAAIRAKKGRKVAAIWPRLRPEHRRLMRGQDGAQVALR